jgi:predicted O-methyltransferase YrrM
MKSRIELFLTLIAFAALASDASAQGGRGSRSGLGMDFESAPLAKDDAEKKILTVLEEMSGRSRGMMSVQRDDGRFLRMLVESIGVKNAVELGTSQGYSSIWTALGLRKTGGKLSTFEIDPQRAKVAKENFTKAGVEKIITLVEGDAHEAVTKLKGEVDFVFLDADKEGYVDYLKKLMPLLSPGTMVVAHNINSRQADPKYIEAITKNPELETLFLALGDGISVTLKKR